MRMAERAMARRAARRLGRLATGAERRRAGDPRGAHVGQSSASRSSPTTYAVLRGLSCAMKLDLLLFGRIRPGRSSRCW